MRVSVLAIGAGLVASASAASSSKAPACVNKCWEYTKYVSTCDQDTACLCEDAEYQNAVYQCLYSQCPTAYFANALHHTLAICSAGQTEADAPALIRQEGLKAKRQDPPTYGGSAPPAYSSAATPPSYMTGSAMPMPSGSARGSPGASGSVPATRTYATRASPMASGSVPASYASSRANPGATGGAGSGAGSGAGGAAPAPTFTGAAAHNGAGFGVVAAGAVAALAAMA